MRTVTYTDKNGYLHRALVRDSDPDEMAVYGVPLDPPDLSRLDWDEIKRVIHNALVSEGISTLEDAERSASGGLGMAVNVFNRYLTQLFRQDMADRRNP